jgi:hypothetical protein
MGSSSLRWDTIKQRVCRHITNEFHYMAWAQDRGIYHPGPTAVLAALEDNTTNWQGKYEELLALCLKRVNDWDVRECGKLRTLFPLGWPANMRRGHLSAFIDDTSEGHWVVTCTPYT